MTTTVFFPAGAPNQSATGQLQNVNDAVVLATDSLGSVDFALAGTPVGATVAFEGTSDGTNWYAMKAYPKVPGSAGATTATAAGSYNVTVGGAAKVRARLTAITSGSFAVVANGTAGAGHVGVKNGNPDDLRVLASPVWGDSIAPPGPSFWESMSRVGTPVYGFLQEQAFAQGSGYGNVQVLAPAATRRLYIRRIVCSSDAIASAQLLLASDTGNVRVSDAGRFGYWRRAIPLSPISGDNPYMPQNTYFPFYLDACRPVEFRFDGEWFMDPGIALMFGAQGIVPNPNPGSIAKSAPNCNVWAEGFEVDFDAY
ncbi:hypothetical protein RA280_19880 [Cupriavidus sp. CV2]|uniref:hypothetical protein n=1 Tax=Cupriavidus ulmosensis TaxID=3065913 RepID=UPI00296B4ED9|nr:hypothetical protein [Cupriavidus sp. CV2]MDW3683964.1 hypothetical protein [Cupriavidus sp. CV2]